mmetsp:Transcript_16757/g.46104  ORF Transcript_16757/g.46104 Transcript_16757/m.46104 type:complete len:338 (+) Transcript_16757:86-1099(+)
MGGAVQQGSGEESSKPGTSAGSLVEVEGPLSLHLLLDEALDPAHTLLHCALLYEVPQRPQGRQAQVLQVGLLQQLLQPAQLLAEVQNGGVDGALQQAVLAPPRSIPLDGLNRGRGHVEDHPGTSGSMCHVVDGEARQGGAHYEHHVAPLDFVERVAVLVRCILGPELPVKQHAARLHGVVPQPGLSVPCHVELRREEVAEHGQRDRCGLRRRGPEVVGPALAVGPVRVDVLDVLRHELRVPLVDWGRGVHAEGDVLQTATLAGKERLRDQRGHQAVRVVELALVRDNLVVQAIDVLGGEQVQLAVGREELWEDVPQAELPLAPAQPQDEAPAHLVVG